jgi:hypothetical protein
MKLYGSEDITPYIPNLSITWMYFTLPSPYTKKNSSRYSLDRRQIGFRAGLVVGENRLSLPPLGIEPDHQNVASACTESSRLT